MEYFVEQATSHREAEAKVRAKYGDRARIMHHKTVRLGGFLGIFSREGVEVTGYFSHENPRPQEPVRKKPTNLEEEKQKILGSVRSDKTIETVLKEIQSLKESLGEREQTEPPAVERREHESITKIEEVLSQNDFTPSYIRKIAARLRRELSIEELDDYDTVEERVVEWIGESIPIAGELPKEQPNIFVLIGPTGVGKTTTIAKLAAMYGIGPGGKASSDVRVLTIDNYRIGARQQIETYGEIMDIPVASVESPEEMKKQIALFEGVDYIFVDTIGKSPREFQKLGEMNELLRACGGRTSTHLAISATTKTSDLDELLRQFEPFNYQSVVLTKLDETTRVGNVVSVLSEKQKAISFITDGQGVPQDISAANVEKLLINLEGLKINRQRVEERFG